jgi:hypothetical protein
LKDGKAMELKERFSQLPLDKENKFKEGSFKAWGRRCLGVFFLCYFSWEREEKDDES